MPSENPVIQYIRLTLIPCFSRLFGKRRRWSSLCLLLTLFVCGLLLTSLCLTFGQNVASLDSLTTDFDDYITTHGITVANQPFRESVRTVLTYAKAEIYISHVCFLALWLVTSLAAVYRVFNESVATEKYVYALHIIYGADTKLLRKGIVREFWVLGLPALGLSLPLSLWLCQDKSEISGFSFVCALEILIAFFLLSLLCAHRVTRRLFKENCVQLMTAIDTSEYISSPRRISLKHTLRRKSGLGLAVTAFGRMKTYRLIHALSLALIGAVLFSMTALTLPDNYATDVSTHEYTLTFGKGISFDALHTDYLPAIESLEAVLSTTPQAGDTAEHLGTHLTLAPNQISRPDSPELLQQEDKWALGTVKIACGDGVTGTELGERTAVIPDKFKDRILTPLGFQLSTVRAGEATYVYPAQNEEPKIQVGDLVEIAIPDGVEGYERYGDHITVKVTSVVDVDYVYTVQEFNHPTVEPVCPRIFEDYLFLSPEDYGLITNTVHTEPVAVTETLAEELNIAEGTCYLILPERMKQDYEKLSHVTVVTPAEAVKKAYTSGRPGDEDSITLPMDTYFINDTCQYSGVYLGGIDEYTASNAAVKAMDGRMAPLAETQTEATPSATQYAVAGQAYSTELSTPCVIFKQEGGMIFTSMATDLSAVTLQKSGCSDSALYFMVAEAAVLTADSDQHYSSGTSMFLTTDIPDEFVTTLDKAGIPLVSPRGKYQLTESTVITTFLHGEDPYILLCFHVTSPLMMDRYPAEIIGAGSYLPKNDRSADTIVPLSELDSMLVFFGDPKGERENATALQGDLATNQFTLMTEQEAGLVSVLAEDQAILRLPKAHPYALTSDDLIHVAISQPLTLELTQMDLAGLDLMAYQIEQLDHTYLPITLTSVEIDPTLSSPVLIVSEDTLCKICGREGVISELKIYVDSYTTLEGLSEVSETLYGLRSEQVALDTRNTVLQSRGTGSQRYPAILRVMLLPLSMLLVLLPLSSARTLYLRREKERSAYIAAGEHKRMRVQMALGEGLLSCFLSGVLYTLLCPLLVLLLKLFCGKFHIPLMPQSFSLTAFLLFLGLILLSPLCASLITLLPQNHPKPHGVKRKEPTEHECIFL